MSGKNAQSTLGASVAWGNDLGGRFWDRKRVGEDERVSKHFVAFVNEWLNGIRRPTGTLIQCFIFIVAVTDTHLLLWAMAPLGGKKINWGDE
jgi:hypothetical protein